MNGRQLSGMAVLPLNGLEWRLAANHRKLNEGPLNDSGPSKPGGPFSTRFNSKPSLSLTSFLVSPDRYLQAPAKY
jgi:hypothetical protein